LTPPLFIIVKSKVT